MFVSASARVSPSLTQPGQARHMDGEAALVARLKDDFDTQGPDLQSVRHDGAVKEWHPALSPSYVLQFPAEAERARRTGFARSLGGNETIRWPHSRSMRFRSSQIAARS